MNQMYLQVILIYTQKYAGTNAKKISVGFEKCKMLWILL